MQLSISYKNYLLISNIYYEVFTSQQFKLHMWGSQYELFYEIKSDTTQS